MVSFNSYVIQVNNDSKVYIVVADTFVEAVEKITVKGEYFNLNSGELVDMKLLYRNHKNEVIL